MATPLRMSVSEPYERPVRPPDAPAQIAGAPKAMPYFRLPSSVAVGGVSVGAHESVMSNDRPPSPPWYDSTRLALLPSPTDDDVAAGYVPSDAHEPVGSEGGWLSEARLRSGGRLVKVLRHSTLFDELRKPDTAWWRA